MPLIKVCLYLIASGIFAQTVGILPVPGPGVVPGVRPGVPIMAGNLLVKCKQTFMPCDLKDLHKKTKAKLISKFPYPQGLELLKIGRGTAFEVAMGVYGSDPRIEYVEPNYIVHAIGAPNDTFFQYQWALQNTGQTGGTSNDDIAATIAWDSKVITDDIVIGTIDTGVDYNHADLKNNIWTNTLEIPGNGIDDDKNGYIDDVHGINAVTGKGDPMDDNMHGTHVAGIIGAEGNNGIGVSGVMQHTKILACKFLDKTGSGDVASAITCMNYFAALATRAKNPVKIVATNNSWGGGSASLAFADAVKYHQKLGILFMAAASNDGTNNDIATAFPANIAYSNVISVAAMDNDDKLASFSNYGVHSVYVAAPGVEILSTIPNNVYNYLSGTSMATPFVTGLAGYIKASDPTLDWISIKNLIISGGQPTPAAADSTISGRRILMTGKGGLGSVSCANQIVTRRLLPKANAYTMKVGQGLVLSMIKINCAKSVQTAAKIENVSVTKPGTCTDKVVELGGLLNDLGQNGDDVAYDGIFTGTFKPVSAGDYQLQFPGDDNVSVKVIN